MTLFGKLGTTKKKLNLLKNLLITASKTNGRYFNQFIYNSRFQACKKSKNNFENIQ